MLFYPHGLFLGLFLNDFIVELAVENMSIVVILLDVDIANRTFLLGLLIEVIFTENTNFIDGMVLLMATFAEN